MCTKYYKRAYYIDLFLLLMRPARDYSNIYLCYPVEVRVECLQKAESVVLGYEQSKLRAVSGPWTSLGKAWFAASSRQCQMC